MESCPHRTCLPGFKGEAKPFRLYCLHWRSCRRCLLGEVKKTLSIGVSIDQQRLHLVDSHAVLPSFSYIVSPRRWEWKNSLTCKRRRSRPRYVCVRLSRTRFISRGLDILFELSKRGCLVSGRFRCSWRKSHQIWKSKTRYIYIISFNWYFLFFIFLLFKLASKQLVGMLIVVVVKKSLKQYFGNVKTSTAGSGILGLMVLSRTYLK